MTRADVIVVGAGVMGAATARALAKEGRDVVVLERFSIGHANGSSHGSARVWRHSYAEPQYVRMMTEALPLWRELEDECGDQLLSATGALNIGDDLRALEDAMGEGSAASEWLSPLAAAERFGVTVDRDVLFDPMAGVVAAERAWRALATSAVKHGATLREGVHVRAVAPHGDGARVETDDGSYDARAVVVTAGSWVQDLVDLPVRPTRETVSYHDVGDPSGLPVLIGWSAPLRYGLPTAEGTFKVGEHIAGPTAHPDGDGAADAASAERARLWLQDALPDRQVEAARAETCMYTNTADQGFLIERRGSIVIGSPCSGHGFKFAPLLGRQIAEMATGRG